MIIFNILAIDNGNPIVNHMMANLRITCGHMKYRYGPDQPCFPGHTSSIIQFNCQEHRAKALEDYRLRHPDKNEDDFYIEQKR